MDSRRKNAWLLLGAVVGFLVLAALFRDGIGLLVFLALAVALAVQLVRVALGQIRPASARELVRALGNAFWGIG